MEITCERCARGHEIADDRIPPFGARLRCSGCGQLFELPAQDNGVRVRVRVGGRRGRNAGDETLPDLVVVTREGTAGPSVGHVAVSPLGDGADAGDRRGDPGPRTPESAELDPPRPEISEPEATETTEPEAPETTEPEAPETTEPEVPETTEPEAPETTEPDFSEPSPPRECPDPRRLARMLLTDVIYGDPERFETARRDGRVLGAFAVEIERAFAFYRQRVGDEIALQTPHFRAALLEVLGRNEPIDD